MASPLSNLSHGTTLPEGTTPHYGYHQQYNDGGKEVVNSGMQHRQNPAYYQHQTHATPGVATPEKKIFGLRRVTFFLLLLSGIFLAGAIGAGAAAGVAASRQNDCSARTPTDDSPSSTSSDTPTSTSSTASTSLTALPLPEEVTRRGSTRNECPDSDQEELRINGTDLVFKRYCGRDYVGNDLGRMPMSTMQDCINLCVAQILRPQGMLPCLGVVWSYDSQQGTDLSFCWLKSEKGTASLKNNHESAWIESYWD